MDRLYDVNSKDFSIFVEDQWWGQQSEMSNFIWVATSGLVAQSGSLETDGSLNSIKFCTIG